MKYITGNLRFFTKVFLNFNIIIVIAIHPIPAITYTGYKAGPPITIKFGFTAEWYVTLSKHDATYVIITAKITTSVNILLPLIYSNKSSLLERVTEYI